ncbi:hypothetical protein PO768_25110 [Paucibacter sp. XJ19-41]|nr:hypothetical protein [Paucibacter sp. XJ19-41]
MSGIWSSPLYSNAWFGEQAESMLDLGYARSWAARAGPAPPQDLAGPELDLADWRQPDVGWGLVVPDDDAVPDGEKALGRDLPLALQKLVAERGQAPVLRWRPDVRDGRLRRYFTDRPAADLRVSGERGVVGLKVPHYLLIAASPAAIPWRVQYRLQTEAFVGRIALSGAALENYIEHLLDEWSRCAVQRATPVVWAVDHAHPDITRLMRTSLADKLAAALRSDPQGEFALDGGHLVAEAARSASLIGALVERRPAFVMTSSHGATYPLDNPLKLRQQLGLPVDQERRLLDLTALAAWNPGGCIWYAHACCSAGSAAVSEFAGILTPYTSLDRTLTAVAGAGDQVAPLPQALLSAPTPLRAFIGHVEPTFDWTLRDPETNQILASPLVNAFSRELHGVSRRPLGMVLQSYVRAVAGLLMDHADALRDHDDLVPGAIERALRSKLMASDRQALVLLGDPTVRMPAPY